LKQREKRYISGESFYYLGRPYPLEACYEPLDNQGVALRNECFFLNCPENKSMRKFYFIAWYKNKALHYISRRVEHYSRLLELKHGGIRITSAERRWGSCSESNRLAFSFRLIMAPPEVVDYVVVHELMHIRQKNHSSKFWDLVLEVLPDYRTHRLWLRDNEHLFGL
ncbi:MAG: M48 family metallopeptidase, partial [Smithella sp.]|nr:M48 family metallopeptidase [Smithella sp.]